MQGDHHDGSTLRADAQGACVLCGGGGAILYEGLRDHGFGVPGEWRVRRCVDPRCGLLWLDPRPREEELVRAYHRYHTHTEARDGVPSRLLNAFCRVCSRVADAFTGLGKQRRQLRMMFLGELPPGKLLEIGSGGGRFLHRMRKAGWEVEGIEFDEKAVRRIAARYGIEVACGTLAAQRYAADTFDAVAMSQLIEHVHAPKELLLECRRVLRPAGRLVLTTPNALARAHAMYGRHWRGLEPPRHLQIFTPAALERLVHETGFVRLQLQTLSAESAGIYRASAAIERVERGVTRNAALTCTPWWQQHLEYVEARQRREVGEDLLLIAAKQR